MKMKLIGTALCIDVDQVRSAQLSVDTITFAFSDGDTLEHEFDDRPAAQAALDEFVRHAVS